jgi:ribosomal protein S18 acetylase RimI-like enzyme
MPLNMRAATPSDEPTLLSLMEALAAHDGDTLDEQMALRGLRPFLADPDCRWGVAWLIEWAGEVAGYVVLTYGYSLEYGGREASIDELYLKTGCRGRGIGAGVIAFLIEHCRSQGINALHLEVFDSNTRAYAFYRREGFRERDSRFMSLIITP